MRAPDTALGGDVACVIMGADRRLPKVRRLSLRLLPGRVLAYYAMCALDTARGAAVARVILEADRYLLGVRRYSLRLRP